MSLMNPRVFVLVCFVLNRTKTNTSTQHREDLQVADRLVMSCDTSHQINYIYTRTHYHRYLIL